MFRSKRIWLSLARVSAAILRSRSLAPVLLAMTLATPAWGQKLTETLEIHGFGGWAFGQTDGNRYLLGDEAGNYDTAEFSLNVSAKPVDNLSIVAQVRLERDRGEEEVELDYAFAEWFFSDAARIRFGRAKHPYGLYAEIFDVGTLRPFYLLPQGIYGDQSITGKNYNGIGLKGTRYLGRWGLEYDVYGGQIETEVAVPGLFSRKPEDLFKPVVKGESVVTDTLGARLTLQFPNGLKLGVSGYSGSQGLDEVLSGTVEPGATRNTYGAHLEYSSRPWLIRAEYANWTVGLLDIEGYYLEVAYYLNKRWQVAGRLDSYGPNYEANPQRLGLLKNDDVGLALNYWFSPTFVLRLNYHFVEGNRMAYPDDPEEIRDVIFNGKINNETEMIVFGAQFSF